MSMGQMTWRAPTELLERVRRAAAARGSSMNEWVTAVMRAATDPDLAGDDAQRLRERLLHAGLLAETPPSQRKRPDRKAVAAARKAAGTGTPLAEIVARERR